mgnify:CR=1 FL=1|jgi:ADP-ribose pyrophosphatase YjhB (NUDIX family)
MIESTLSMPVEPELEVLAAPGGIVDAVESLDASALCINEEKESVDVAAAEDDKDIVAAAESKAESAPCESTIVVIHLEFGSGGNLTRVMIPGTTSEKYRDTKVDISDDLPTPSGKTAKKITKLITC